MRKFPTGDRKNDFPEPIKGIVDSTDLAIEQVFFPKLQEVNYVALENEIKMDNIEEYKSGIPLNIILEKIFPKEELYGAKIRVMADTSFYVLQKGLMDMVGEEDNTYTLKDTSNKNIKDLVGDSYGFKISDGYLRISSRTADFKPKTVGFISDIVIDI